MFLKGPFTPGILSIELPWGLPIDSYYCGWPIYGPRVVTYHDGHIAVFYGGDYEQLWYRARCWFHKKHGEEIPQ